MLKLLSYPKEKKEHSIVYQKYSKVNSDSAIDFLSKLTATSHATQIHIICDNAPYYKSQKVKDFVEKAAIKIHFLPPYSPNLNPIERLWKIMRQAACYNSYYHSFEEFTEKINAFFSNIDTQQAKIKQRINDHFQRFEPNIITKCF